MPYLKVVLSQQKVYFLSDDHQCLNEWPVSTALKGAGEQKGSFQTPRGRFKIRLKIGQDAPDNAVFVGRRFTGECYSSTLAAQYPERDWILSRILWLTGCESGKNRGGKVDTLSRYIYFHGTPETEPMGIPASHGCIRLYSHAMIALFEHAECGMTVMIEEDTV